MMNTYGIVKNIIYRSKATGAEVYMEVTRDASSLYIQAAFMVYIPHVGLSKRFTISMRTLLGKASADEFLNMGFTREEVNDIECAIRSNFKNMVITDDGASYSIEMVHKILTWEALAGGYVKEINGTQYCAVPTETFRKMVRDLDLGYRSHLEILKNFRMLKVLFHNAKRLDYRKKDFEPSYCFKPAEGVTADSDLWGDCMEIAVPDTDKNNNGTQEVKNAA